MQTRWSYLFSYRAHFGASGYAEMSGTAESDNEASELDIQQWCVDNLPEHPDMPSGVRPEDIVITRFHYVSCPPLSVPDTGWVSLDKTRDTATGQDKV